ncbi:hypothetical protein PUN28_018372 [Cardiocondyla obscurior]|uniref:Uncharacterized protein n=1 Tax=Cardiocondyla obscurior TaxID=286306 RepID=A0AAW2EIK9_9HYME
MRREGKEEERRGAPSDRETPRERVSALGELQGGLSLFLARSGCARHTDSLRGVYFYSGHRGAGQLVNRHSGIDALARVRSARPPRVPCALPLLSFTGPRCPRNHRRLPPPSPPLSLSITVQRPETLMS